MIPLAVVFGGVESHMRPSTPVYLWQYCTSLTHEAIHSRLVMAILYKLDRLDEEVESHMRPSTPVYLWQYCTSLTHEAIHSRLLIAILYKLDRLDEEVETEVNRFEMLPLRTMEALNQLEAELVDESKLKQLVGLPNRVDT